MAQTTSNPDFQRARTDTQKLERRRDILVAARAHLADVGVDRFSMAPLGKAAGVSRATLYLYFATREEVLLALYLEETQGWLDDLASRTGADMAVEDYLRAVFTTAVGRPLFMELAPRVTGVIESNVSIESLAESKRVSAALVENAGRRTALALGRPLERGVELAIGLYALLLGVTHTSRTPDVDLRRLPPDVVALLDGEEAVEVFVRLGGWLVAGAGRSGAG